MAAPQNDFWRERKAQSEKTRRSLRDRFGIHDTNYIEYHAAGELLALFMGLEWHSRKIALRADPDPWMLNGDDHWLRDNPVENDVRRIVHCVRTIRLADALFTLVITGSLGSGHVRERLLTRPMKSTFTELEIGSLLVVNGFQTCIKDEVGKRGEDYDIEAISGDVRVSVEVTAKNGDFLSEGTLLNTLAAKRNQVPKDRPAVLYLHVPADWMLYSEQKELFSRAFSKFYRRSGRFNAIVLLSESVVPQADDKGLPRLTMQASFNELARHELPNREVFGSPKEVNGRLRMAFSYFDAVQERGGNV